MKRIIAMILVIIMTLHLTACGQNDSIDLMQDVPAKALEVQPDMDAGAGAAADFGVWLFQTATEDGKNTLISPLSVLYALAMTANGADGETLAQMEEVLGMDDKYTVFPIPQTQIDLNSNLVQNDLWK